MNCDEAQVGARVTVSADAPIHAGSHGEVVEVDPSGYDGMTHKVQLANYWLWFRPYHLTASDLAVSPSERTPGPPSGCAPADTRRPRHPTRGDP